MTWQEMALTRWLDLIIWTLTCQQMITDKWSNKLVSSDYATKGEIFMEWFQDFVNGNTPENFKFIWQQEHCVRWRDGQMNRTFHRGACLQLKIKWNSWQKHYKTSYEYAMASWITRNVTLLNNLFRVTTRKPSRLCITTLCCDSIGKWKVGLCYDTISIRDGCILQQVEWHSVADIIICGVTNGRLAAMFRNGCLIICRNKVYIGHTSAMWHESYVCGSSHRTVAVSSPGFAINW